MFTVAAAFIAVAVWPADSFTVFATTVVLVDDSFTVALTAPVDTRKFGKYGPHAT